MKNTKKLVVRIFLAVILILLVAFGSYKFISIVEDKGYKLPQYNSNSNNNLIPVDETPETTSVEPRLNILSPQGGEIWRENRAYRINWESEGIREVIVKAFMGESEIATIGKVQASEDNIVWYISEGLVTNINSSGSNEISIKIFDALSKELYDTSDNLFSVIPKEDK